MSNCITEQWFRDTAKHAIGPKQAMVTPKERPLCRFSCHKSTALEWHSSNKGIVCTGRSWACSTILCSELTSGARCGPVNGTSIPMQRVCTLGRSVVAWGRQEMAFCTRIRDTMAPWAGATISQAVFDSGSLHMSRTLTCNAPLAHSVLRGASHTGKLRRCWSVHSGVLLMATL